MDASVVYTSCGCNRTPFSADWGHNNLLVYAGCQAVVVCQPKSPCHVIQTLAGHKDRVNSVQWIRRPFKGHETELISSSTDKSAIVWRRLGDNFKSVAHLEGHTGAVTLAAGLYVTDKVDVSEDDLMPRTLIATASADSSVKIWERKKNKAEFNCLQSVSFGTGFSLALSWIQLPGTKVPLLACGGDDQKIHLLAEEETKFRCVQTLSGHEDWIRGLELIVDDHSNVLLASCSQDQYIRIWRLSSHDPESQPSSDHSIMSLDSEIQMKQQTFSIINEDDGRSVYFAVTLESVLQGHEGWIYSVHWHPPVMKGDLKHQPPILLSASMDKTLILWCPDEETGLWIEKVRVGAVGGNTLGFYGGLFGPDGQSILSHGYQGSFHVWHQDQDSNTWLPGVTVGGHFSSVEDIGWDPESGQFLVSVSLDQSTRLHGYWKSEDKTERSWHELARPQIHGYDIQCLAMLSRWSFASGADEKVIRVLEAPMNFVENLGRLSGIDVSKSISEKSDSSLPEGASIPALGLSNKAVFQDSTLPPTYDRVLDTGSSSQYPEVYFSPLKLTAPPSEDNLLQNTLWPEVQKLYGHGYEIFALAYHPKHNILASACKAAKPEHAAVLLWDASSWHLIGQLQGHSLTVTQLAFSHNGNYLLSTSRDRTWSLYKWMKSGTNSGVPYTRIAYTDKKTSVHTRIIWSASWSPEDKYFVTVSRDKKAVVWTLDPDTNPEHDTLGSCRAYSMPLEMPESITAVDFAPCKLGDNCYLIAFGLDDGSIQTYKWLADNNLSGDRQWTKVALLDQSMAHHLTVKRLLFRPVTGEVGSEDIAVSGLTLQLASCGADHKVKIYTIRNIS